MKPSEVTEERETGRLLAENRRLREELAAARASEALPEDARFRRLIDELPLGVVAYGSRAEVLVANAKAAELLGVTGQELHDRTAFDASWSAIHEDGSDFAAALHPVPVAQRTKKPVHDVLMGVRRPSKSDLVWLLVNASPELDDEGEVSRVICTFLDVTARRLLESSRQRAQKLESLGRLAAGMAHEFNNLLTVVATHISFAGEGASPAAELDLKRALDATERAGELTAQLLAFAPQEVISPRICDLRELLPRMGARLRDVLGDAIRLELRLADDVGLVRIDPARLEESLSELAANARDAMASGGTLTVSVENARIEPTAPGAAADVPSGDYVLLAVTDDGAGMSPAVRARAFEPFFTTKAIGRGKGMGLATVHGAMKQHGGHMRLESEPGRGARFEIFLPKRPRRGS